MKKSILFTAAFIFMLIQFSCKKDDQNLTRKELLTNNTWIIVSKIISPTVSMGGMTIDDISILDSEAVRNYTYKYNMDGTMFLYNQLNEKIFETGWSFNADESQLTHSPGIVYNYPMVGDMSLNTINIESITANQMIAKVPYNFNGTDYMVTFSCNAK